MLSSFYLSAFIWGKSILVSLSRVCGVVVQLLTSPDSLMPSRIAALMTAYKTHMPTAKEITSMVTVKMVNLVSSNSMGLIGFPLVSGMTLSVCGPSDINGAGPVMTAPPAPGPGVRISAVRIPANATSWHQVAEFLSVQMFAKRERANRLKRAARARRERSL